MLRPQVALMLSVRRSLESHCGDCLLTQLGVLEIAKPGLLLGEVGTPQRELPQAHLPSFHTPWHSQGLATQYMSFVPQGLASQLRTKDKYSGIV